MKVLVVLASLGLVVLGSKMDQGQKEVDQEKVGRCRDVTKKFNECTKKAYGKYTAALAVGDDGRPNFAARKACNYLTDGVQTCGDLLYGECNSDEKVEELKDYQMKGILTNIQTTITEWDSSKCPAIKSQMGGAEENTVVEGEYKEEETKEEEQEGEKEEGPEKVGEEGTEEKEEGEEDQTETDSEDSATDDPESGVSGLMVTPALVAVLLLL